MKSLTSGCSSDKTTGRGKASFTVTSEDNPYYKTKRLMRASSVWVTMLLKCLLIFGLIFSLEAASIPKGIPVNVVYLETTKIPDNAGDKAQVRYLQNKNLDEKVQLSSRELKEANQHIPLPEAGVDDGKIFLKAKSVFLERLTNFKHQVDGFSLKTPQKKPNAEDWSKLNEKLQVVFKKYENTGLRQNQGSFISEMTQATGEWFQSVIGNNNNKPSGGEDEKPEEKPEENQGGLQQIWNNFQNGIAQTFGNIINQSNNNDSKPQEGTTSNTVLGDTGVQTTTKAPGFFEGLFTNLNINNNQGNKPGQESDTGVTPPQNIFQGAINNIINTFSSSSEKPPNSQGDTGETSTSRPGNQFIQNIQNIGNNFGQLFGQTTKPPGVSGDNEATNGPTNFFQNIGTAIQGVFNQNQASGSQSEGTTSAPNIINQGLQQIQIPGQNGGIEQFQNTGQQIVQNFQNPQNIGQQISSNIPAGSQNNTFQSIGQQITQGFQNPDQSQNIGQQITSGSLGQQISEVFQNQNFASQAQNIGQQITGNAPSDSQGGTGQAVGQQISQAFQNPQNFASQAQNIGQQITGNAPSDSQGSTGQAVGQQISQAFQNPQNFASQAQNIGQQLSENLPSVPQNNAGQGSQSSVSNLNVNQIPVVGQQFGQNSQNPIQAIGEQFQAGNPTNIINQIQSSTNQIQNPSINPVNLIDNQNQQVNVNQLTQIIPSSSENNSNGIQSAITNQFNNGLAQLNGSNNNAQQANADKPVKEEQVEKKALVDENKNKGEGEIMEAFER
ncbi:GATA zinc finger domain-containing protein 14-like [Harmonia axyridis]|uniref:GATA zinc finger domain-containing protein 14-like n=1 Tax=Harmonia axyridis TaxID=115357 RepID=UPI001E2799FE|nr:GATA zinc finger domain-containing protein 14-like [Harmonia axyridis]